MEAVTGQLEWKIDSDLKSVVEFMSRNVQASKLLSVAASLHVLAPLIWGRYVQEPMEPITTSCGLISCETPLNANESGLIDSCVGGNSAVGVSAPAQPHP